MKGGFLLFNILFIGLGPHAKHHHFKLIMMMEKYFEVRCCGVVELLSQKESVQKYLSLNGKSYIPVFYVDDKERDFQELSSKANCFLSKIVDELRINKVIISTEPKAHMAYIKWAITKRIDFIVDKPIFIETYMSVLEHRKSLLYEKYLETFRIIHNKGINASVMMPRRLHPAIKYVYDYLSHFVFEYEVPITHINMMHGEGMWNMPEEFFSRENHPYKYGYGAYFHTGYHFIDLLCYFLSINSKIKKTSYDKMEIALSNTRPKDVCSMFGEKAYNKLIGVDNVVPYIKEMSGLGEVDWQLLINFCKNGSVCASGNLDIQQSNYSSRKSKFLPEDVYKDNGRIYHEFISVDVAHLLSIKISRMTIGNQPNIEKYKKEDKFVIQIFRNQNIVGGKAFDEIEMPYKTYIMLDQTNVPINMGDLARYNILYDWLFDNSQQTSFLTHKESMFLFSEVHTLLASMHNSNQTMGCYVVPFNV